MFKNKPEVVLMPSNNEDSNVNKNPQKFDSELNNSKSLNEELPVGSSLIGNSENNVSKVLVDVQSNIFVDSDLGFKDEKIIANSFKSSPDVFLDPLKSQQNINLELKEAVILGSESGLLNKINTSILVEKNDQASINIGLSNILKPLSIETDSPILSADWCFSISLKNSTVGVNFRQPIKLLARKKTDSIKEQKQEVKEVKILRKDNDFIKIGLNISDDINTLGGISVYGVPNASGDYKVQLTFSVPSADYNSMKPEVRYQGEIKLTVNPDPRSLWKDLPSDPNGVFQKPSTDKKIIIESDVLCAAASRRGRSHAHEGLFRDDDFCVEYLKDGDFWVIAVADGAGSCKLSRRGSQIACIEAVHSVKEQLLKVGYPAFSETVSKGQSLSEISSIKNLLYNILGNAAFNAYQKIGKQAEEFGKPIKDFSTTLNLTLCKKIANQWFIATYAVGDGGVVAIRSSGEVLALSVPEEGEYAGQTHFLIESGIWKAEEVAKRIKYFLVDDLKYIIAMTDGITDPYFSNTTDLSSRELWGDFIKNIKPLVLLEKNNLKLDESLLSWLDFWVQGNHDDRTIAVLVP
jgi:hypothetical protein